MKAYELNNGFSLKVIEDYLPKDMRKRLEDTGGKMLLITSKNKKYEL